MEATPTTTKADEPAILKQLDHERDTNRLLRSVVGRRNAAASIHERIARAWATLEKLSRRLMGSRAKVLPPATSGDGGLWQDPLTGLLYRRYPITLTKHTTGAEVFDVLRYDRSSRAPVELFAYDVPDGVELQFIPNFALHYLSGSLVRLDGEGGKVVPVAGGYSCRLDATDHFGAIHRGVIWSGTTDDINDSVKCRLTGHPIVYGADVNVHLLGGDRLRLLAWIPRDAESVVFHPLSNPDLSFLELHCYQLVRVRFDDDGPILRDSLRPVKRRPKTRAKRGSTKKTRKTRRTTHVA